MSLPAVLLTGSIVLFIIGWGFYVRAAWRHHLLMEARERALGNRRLRRRLYGLVGRKRGEAEVVVRAEHMRGWVWIRVTNRKPLPGELPVEAHEEQMGWAMTRRGAMRKMQRETRGEQGSITDLALMVMGLIIAAALVSKVAADVTPGDVLDWLLERGEELVRYVF